LFKHGGRRKAVYISQQVFVFGMKPAPSVAMSEAISGNERDACLNIHTMTSSAKADDPVFREAIDHRPLSA
jgi:hypothetical protein